jgi:hypothetical protein
VNGLLVTRPIECRRDYQKISCESLRGAGGIILLTERPRRITAHGNELRIMRGRGAVLERRDKIIHAGIIVTDA